jgi:hypothetical protein
MELIRANIAERGHHLYVVSGGPSPRHAYTIGLSPVLGAELILAGASFYTLDEVRQLVNQAAGLLRSQPDSTRSILSSDSPPGSFSFRPVDPSWAAELMLGAVDFYATKQVAALQIVPDSAHSTIDVPDLRQPWDPQREPAWQWLARPWQYSVPDSSVSMTNLAALMGARITEAVRWETDQWEMFAGAGPDVSDEQARAVPLATLLASDPSLDIVTSLNLGEGVWRSAEDLHWHPWKHKGNS